jgi:hypothetical protein
MCKKCLTRYVATCGGGARPGWELPTCSECGHAFDPGEPGAGEYHLDGKPTGIGICDICKDGVKRPKDESGFNYGNTDWGGHLSVNVDS